ncbi:Hpt domain-containing protein [Paraherbaspirillum soli]|uniref:Hpt domain-containing protein n=1 Tax=Paraherbaspirillum soli TaxID=631222 RepID=A0ABW0MET1_9BURK
MKNTLEARCDLNPLDRFDPVSPQRKPELAADLRALFRESAGQDLVAIEQALAHGDYTSMKQHVHRFKGAAMMFDAAVIVEAIQHIEAILHAGGMMTNPDYKLAYACGLLRRQVGLL